jgi:DNA-binding transcriptional ArsR family regulator
MSWTHGHSRRSWWNSSLLDRGLSTVAGIVVGGGLGGSARERDLGPRPLGAILHKALDQAMGWDLIGRNVADLVDPPTIARTPMRALTPEESRRFLETGSPPVSYNLHMRSDNAEWQTLTEEQVVVAVESFRLLADPTRVRLLWVLLQGERSVNDLAAEAGAQPSAISHHLAKLRLARLVRPRREGTRMYYAMENVHVAQLLREGLFHADHVAQGLPDHGSTI